MLGGVLGDMSVMVRTPIILAILAFAAPAQAASGDVRGWSLDTGGALGIAKLALRAIDRGDVAAITDDRQGPHASVASDPTKIGLRTSGRDDVRPEDPVAGISARFTF
jgi:hypothetical protein